MTASASDPYDLAVIGAGRPGSPAPSPPPNSACRVALLDADRRSTGGQFYRHPAPGLGAGAARGAAPRLGGLRRGCAGGSEHERRQPPRRTPCLGGRPSEDGGRVGGARRHRRRRHRERPRRVRARARAARHRRVRAATALPRLDLPGVVTAGGAQAMLKAGLVAARQARRRGGHRPAAARRGRRRWPPRARGCRPWSRPSGYLRLRPPAPARSSPTRQARGGGRSTVPLCCGTGCGCAPRSAVTAGARRRPGGGRHRRPARPRLAARARQRAAGSRATRSPSATACPADRAGRRTRLRHPPPGRRDSSPWPLDGQQRTTVPGVWAAGETAGVGGAAARPGRGRARRPGGCRQAGRAPSARRASASCSAAGTGCAPSPTRWTPRLPRAPGWTGWLTDDTLVCRCEEVPAGRIREAVDDLGARDARTVKLLTRAGMGWCQGRMCGSAVACLAARGCRGTTRCAGRSLCPFRSRHWPRSRRTRRDRARPGAGRRPLTRGTPCGRRTPRSKMSHITERLRHDRHRLNSTRPWHGVMVATALPAARRPVRRLRRATPSTCAGWSTNGCDGVVPERLARASTRRSPTEERARVVATAVEAAGGGARSCRASPPTARRGPPLGRAGRRGRLPAGDAAAAERLPRRRAAPCSRTTARSPRPGCRSSRTTTRSTPRST